MADALLGRVVGGCRVDRVLGAGGMGTVYFAIQADLDRPVALKVLPPQLSSNEAFVARFEREAKTIAQLNHPNIVQVYFTGQDGPLRFIAMELAEGKALSELLTLRGKLPVAEACDIIVQCAEALKAAWSRGIVHRDIKPENIIVAGGGHVKVADFGLAKNTVEVGAFTQSGAVMGTPHYMSPEQCRGEPTDIRTDLYALGLTLWECLAGRKPFEGEIALSILNRHMSEDVPDLKPLAPDVPDAVLDLVKRMTERRVDKRAQGPEEVIQALDAWLTASGRRERARAEQSEGAKAGFKTLVDLRTGECRSCHAVNAAGRTFCAQCGTALFEPCPACGFEGNAAPAQFCGKCAANLQVAQQVRRLGEKAAELLRRHQREPAIQLLEEACKLDPAQPRLARWVSELRGELGAVEQLKKELSEHLEEGRYEQAERSAERLMGLLPGDTSVSDLPTDIRDAARLKWLQDREDAFIKLTLSGRMESAARVLHEVAQVETQDPIVVRMNQRLATWRGEFEQASSRAEELMHGNLWKQAEPVARRASELDAESFEAQDRVRKITARLEALLVLREEITRALTSARLFKAFDLAAKVKALDPARDVLGDLPGRVAGRLEEYKAGLRRAKELSAARSWRESLETARALRSAETEDREADEIVAKSERASTTVESARQFVERFRGEAMRYPDLASSLESLIALLPDPEGSSYRTLAEELKAAYVAQASADARRLTKSGRFKPAEAVIATLRPHDEQAASRAEASIRTWAAVRRTAIGLLMATIVIALGYLSYRLLR